MKRRYFTKFIIFYLILKFLSSCAHKFQSFKSLGVRNKKSFNDDPIQSLDLNNSFISQYDSNFLGDEDPKDIHKNLWDKNKFNALSSSKISESEVHYDVVVVGGGVSGLIATSLLKDLNLKVLTLEQAKNFGGNSKALEVKYHDDIVFCPLGAAYISKFDDKLEIKNFLEKNNLLEDLKFISHSDNKYWLRGDIRENFVSENLSEKELKKEIFNLILKNKSLVEDFNSSSFINLDKLNFLDWLNRENKKPIEKSILNFFEAYSRSAFCLKLNEVSAAHFLNFTSSELQGVYAYPGGNAWIASRIFNHLCSNQNIDLKSQALVLRIDYLKDKVKIYYLEDFKNLKIIYAKSVIVAAPKFVAKNIIYKIPDEQLRAMNSIRYRSYLVANVLIKKKLGFNTYDVFNLDFNSKLSDVTTDFICHDIFYDNLKDITVFTFYKPLVDDFGRKKILESNSFIKVKQEFLNDIRGFLFKNLNVSVQSSKGSKANIDRTSLWSEANITEEDILKIYVSRFGHALPLAYSNLIANKVAQTASMPIENKVFFANQDNWVNPSFESCFYSAKNAVNLVKNSI